MTARRFSNFHLIIILFCFIANSGLAQGERTFHAQGSFGAVSTGHPEATRIARKILENGGNAIDAAVAAAFMLGVVDFTNSGPGGDAFALIHLGDGRILAFDGSIRKPQRFEQNKSHIGLPTEPELLLKLLHEFGSRSAVEVLAPSIRTCIKGFKVTAYLNQVIRKKLLRLTDPAAIKFLAPNGHALPAGSVLKQPVLALTLQRLARDLGASFYQGDDARLMVAHMNSLGSAYNLADLKNYSSRLTMPVKLDWKSYSLYGNPPPASSIVAIKLAQNLAESSLDLFAENVRNIQTIAQAGRKFIDFKYNYLSNYLIEPERFFADSDLSKPAQILEPEKDDDSMTTHLCVWDKNNMAVALTLTLGSHCGTGQLSPLGFFYNNEMRNYTSVVASYPADYPANAGPISSKAPLMLKNGDKLVAVLGGAGSDRIIFNTGLLAARIIQTPEKALATINRPRFFLDYRNILQLEWNPDLVSENGKENLNANCNWRESGDDYFGLISAIYRKNDNLKACGDFRRDGDCAAIKADPVRSRCFNLSLNFSRTKGFRELKIAGPINDERQSATTWTSPVAYSSHMHNGFTIFAYEAKKQFTDRLKTSIKINPANRPEQRMKNILNEKPVFCEKGLSPEIADFARKYQDCKSVRELVRKLMIDIGFAIPYHKTRKKTSAIDLLMAGKGDCSGKARLMHEILRAYGQTTRLCGGVIAGKRLKTTTHLWVEIQEKNQWLAICPVNFYFGQIPSNWLKFRYGEMQTAEPGGKLIFSISEEL